MALATSGLLEQHVKAVEARSNRGRPGERLRVTSASSPEQRQGTGAVMPSADLRAAITSAPMSAVLIALNLTVFIAVSIEGRLLDVLALPPDRPGRCSRSSSPPRC
jgi:hypothetical protein